MENLDIKELRNVINEHKEKSKRLKVAVKEYDEFIEKCDKALNKIEEKKE